MSDMDKIRPLASKCRTATPHDTVLNSECVYTFNNPYTTPSGIVVNLRTYIGSIDALSFGPKGSGEDLFVRICKIRALKQKEEETESNGTGELEEKVTKLGVGVEGGFQEDDDFEVLSTYSVVLLKGQDGEVTNVVELPFSEETKNDFPMNITASVESIIHHAGAAVQQDLKAWELDDEKVESKYTQSLEFVDNGVTISPNPADWKCEKSGDTENLWLNLSTGFIGGGRKNWDGSGGSNGALDHFIETGEKYPLVVKLGTITEDIETADCYSYAKDEDGPVKVSNLEELLKKRGIRVAGMKKTVKSTAELEVELNATYAFDAITESGAKLVPVSGPGLQGLQNLGNSCYINSVLQMLFSGTVPELASRYGQNEGEITTNPLLNVSPIDAPSDLLCQSAKIGCALTSGKFACPVPASEVTDSKSPTNDPKYRLPPRMFKHIVGKDHVDFCTNQQQDAAQFLQYLLEKIDRAEAGSSGRLVDKLDADAEAPPKSSNLFAFNTMSRQVCSRDKKIKYKENNPETILSLRVPMPESASAMDTDSSDPPDEKRQKSEGAEEEVPTVSFSTCLDAWSAPHVIDGIRWAHLNNAVSSADEETRFSNFPRYMIVQIQRYELGPDWTPRKLEVNIDMPEEIDLNALKSVGPKDGEDIVPEEEEAVATEPQTPQINIDEGAISQLMDMGFGMNGCKRALIAVGGSNVESAMNWIFEHNSDPDFDDPLPEFDSAAASLSTDGGGVDEGVVASLVASLGCFTADQVRAAVKECDGQADRAADWLFSHMDDLDGAIAMLQSKEAGAKPSAVSSSTSVVEDGDGKYSLVGLVSHIGKNTGSGHYVAHLKKDDQWVIFNDEKVALSEAPPTPHAYLYLFQRTDSIGSPNRSY